MDFESKLEKIVKDIRDREDREMALAFTNVVCSLLRENGVAVKTSRYEFETHNETHNETDKNTYIIKQDYGVSFDGLDFAEHDKRFKDEITQLKHDLDKMTTHHDEFKKEAQDVIEELEKTRSDWVDNAVAWKEKFEKAEKEIKELESELKVKENLLKIKNGLCGNDEIKDKEPIEIAMYIIKGRNIDDLEQIAQHIQVYCRHTRSRRDDTIAF